MRLTTESRDRPGRPSGRFHPFANAAREGTELRGFAGGDVAPVTNGRLPTLWGDAVSSRFCGSVGWQMGRSIPHLVHIAPPNTLFAHPRRGPLRHSRSAPLCRLVSHRASTRRTTRANAACHLAASSDPYPSHRSGPPRRVDALLDQFSDDPQETPHLGLLLEQHLRSLDGTPLPRRAVQLL